MSKSVVQPDNRLTFMDQAGIQLLRATGRGQLMQIVWIYEHPLDIDGLRRFHRNFGYGLAGRRIERSPLPFGRYRWVSSLGPQAGIDFIEQPRPREALSDWVDERSQVPVDPEWGPGWHIGVLPMTDGSTAVSLVGSHHLGDGAGALLSIVEATMASNRHLGYPLPRSRKRFRGALSDLRDTAKGAPGAARTLVRAAKLGLRSRGEATAPAAPQKPPKVRPVGGGNVVVPAVSFLVDQQDWDDRAKSLNGNSYSLCAGVAAKLAEQMGRIGPDGAVTLNVALNDRASLDDTRAHAMLFAPVTLDPAPVTTDLSDARIVIRQALKKARETTDEALQLLPLVPYVPRRALKRVVEQFLGSGAELPVSCSNMGDLHPNVARVDGTDAEHVLLRGVDQNVLRADIERAGGQLVVVAGRIGGKVSATAVAYQVGAQNSKDRLRELIKHALAEFDLTGEIY
jgi:hypothetical protein